MFSKILNFTLSNAYAANNYQLFFIHGSLKKLMNLGEKEFEKVFSKATDLLVKQTRQCESDLTLKFNKDKIPRSETRSLLLVLDKILKYDKRDYETDKIKGQGYCPTMMEESVIPKKFHQSLCYDIYSLAKCFHEFNNKNKNVTDKRKKDNESPTTQERQDGVRVKPR